MDKATCDGQGTCRAPASAGQLCRSDANLDLVCK
jgi:hypothetical protein